MRRAAVVHLNFCPLCNGELGADEIALEIHVGAELTRRRRAEEKSEGEGEAPADAAEPAPAETSGGDDSPA